MGNFVFDTDGIWVLPRVIFFDPNFRHFLNSKHPLDPTSVRSSRRAVQNRCRNMFLTPGKGCYTMSPRQAH